MGSHEHVHISLGAELRVYGYEESHAQAAHAALSARGIACSAPLIKAVLCGRFSTYEEARNASGPVKEALEAAGLGGVTTVHVELIEERTY